MKAADGETIDRVREAEGAEEKIKVEIDATNQWLKINAEEVFHKIHELERHLNHHKKHTSIPNWAQSINPRLDGIDAKLSKLATTSGAKETQNSSLSDGQTFQSMQKFVFVDQGALHNERKCRCFVQEP